MLIEDSEAWKLLTQEEQTALTLQIGQEMSSWKVGEILGRNHYKYLEIFNRAKTFLKIFTEHYEMYGDVVPDYIDASPDFLQYINLCITTRESIPKVVKQLDSKSFVVGSVRKHEIIKNMVHLYNHEDIVQKNFAVFIREFDRWNNFRILPKEVQELSAFPRRIKATFRKVLLKTATIHDFFFEKLKDDYHNPKFPYYAVLFSDTKPDLKFIQISDEAEIVREFSKLGIFVFKTQSEAESFHELVREFDIRNPKHCKKGQLFWPKFRDAVKYCINATNIQQAIPHSSFNHIK